MKRYHFISEAIFPNPKDVVKMLSSLSSFQKICDGYKTSNWSRMRSLLHTKVPAQPPGYFQYCLKSGSPPNLVLKKVFLVSLSLSFSNTIRISNPSGPLKSNIWKPFLLLSDAGSEPEVRQTYFRDAQSRNKQDVASHRDPSDQSSPALIIQSHPPRSVKGVSVGIEVRPQTPISTLSL